MSGDLPLVKPSDPTIPTLSGQFVANDIWLQVEKPLDHVFKFKVQNSTSAAVTIQPAGSSGVDARAEAIVDSDGEVVGLKVIEPSGDTFLVPLVLVSSSDISESKSNFARWSGNGSRYFMGTKSK